MPAKTITHTLEALNSKRDFYGNCYWALRLTDHQTGQTVLGTVSGGEGNIRGIMRHWNVPDDWDRGVQFQTRELPIREFNRRTKSWPYAGCTPEDLAAWCRAELAKQEAAARQEMEAKNRPAGKWFVGVKSGRPGAKAWVLVRELPNGSIETFTRAGGKTERYRTASEAMREADKKNEETAAAMV